VRAEIQEHYQSAHEAALANGAASQEADLMAVTALGDARSANRQYRRVLLTVREAKLLHFMTRPSSLPPGRVTLGKWLAGILVAEAIGGMFLVALKDPAWLYFSLALLGAFLISLLPIDTPSRGRTYRCAKWAAFMGGAALAAWYGVKPAWIPLACLLFPAYQEYLRMSIRRKLPGDQWPKWLYR
jgi:hypothetical protein